MRSNSIPIFIFRLSRFPVYRGSVLGRFYCILLFCGSLYLRFIQITSVSCTTTCNFKQCSQEHDHVATLLQQKLSFIITLPILETHTLQYLQHGILVHFTPCNLIIFTNSFCAMENSPALYTIKIMQHNKFY
jgi:hypothetical protein